MSSSNSGKNDDTPAKEGTREAQEDAVEMEHRAEIASLEKSYGRLTELFLNFAVDEWRADDDDVGEYRAEREEIHRIISTERNSVLAGVASGIAFFASVRFARQRYVKSKGIDAEHGKSRAAIALQRTIAIIVEGFFAVLAGRAVYNFNSGRSKQMATAIAEIPLCPGKSKAAERICPRWVHITTNQGPPSFWENIDNMPNAKRWHLFKEFSDNCIRRKRFEEQIRGRDANEELPVFLPTRVPEISQDEANQLTSDR